MSNPIDTDYEYLSITVTNDGTKFSTCAYNENRVTPLISTMEDYVLQVVNFTVPSQTIPLFNYRAPLTAEFYVMYTGATTTGQPIKIGPVTVALTNGIPTTQAQTKANDNGEPFGGIFNQSDQCVYSVQMFVLAMNTALESLFTLITSDVQIIVKPLPVVKAPFITYNETTGLFSITGDVRLNITDPLYENIELWSNEFVHTLLFGLPSFETRINSIPNYRYLFFNTYNNNVSVSGVSNYVMTTQGSPINYWISAKKIIVTSNRMNVNTEAISDNNNVDGRPITKNIVIDFNINTLNTLTDFYTPITFTQFNDMQNLINFIGAGPIYTIDFEFAYIDNLGRTFPIILGIGQSFTLKLKFQKYR